MFKPEFLMKVLGKAANLRTAATRIWTDSRSLEQGDLFAAVSGDKFDGHNFVSEAAKQGALGAIVSKTTFPGSETLPHDFSLIPVPDTIEALRDLARAYRQTLEAKIFAVAGSNGKTTTKEWIAFLLGEALGKESVFKTKKSNNSILGIALSLLQIRSEKVAVIEIGIDEPGWMEKHLDVVRPDAGVITMIGEEHLNQLKDIETVAEEELKLLHYLRKSKGSFAANLDSPFIADQDFPDDTLSFALEKRAQIEGRYAAPNGLKAFGLHWANPLPGRHNAQNLLAALAALRLMIPTIDLDQLKKLSLAGPTFRGESHRGLWLTYERGIRVFDDSYNANPESMERALETFLELSDGCHQTLVLGDMLDLGEATERSHARILNLALVSGVERILLFGPHFSQAWEKAKRVWPKNSQTQVQTFTEIDALKSAIKANLKRDDCFMIKGSRGMALERSLEIFEDQPLNP